MRRRRKKRNQQQVSLPRPKPQPKRNQFVIRHEKGWAVKKEGSNRITAQFQTQAEAIEYARDLAITQRCELVIHDRKGNVRKQQSYKDRRHQIARQEAFMEWIRSQTPAQTSFTPASANATNN
jgi:Uncharacterized protein conserved in bacteria (DUF2188)